MAGRRAGDGPGRGAGASPARNGPDGPTEPVAQRHAGAERERTEILSSAYSEAEKIRGEGDAIAAETYASAFNRDPDFYAFWRSLGAYRGVFERGGSMMVLDPDSEFFRFFGSDRQPGR